MRRVSRRAAGLVCWIGLCTAAPVFGQDDTDAKESVEDRKERLIRVAESVIAEGEARASVLGDLLRARTDFKAPQMGLDVVSRRP